MLVQYSILRLATYAAHLLRSNVIFDLVLNSLQNVFSCNGGEIGAIEDRVDDGDVLLANVRRHCPSQVKGASKVGWTYKT